MTMSYQEAGKLGYKISKEKLLLHIEDRKQSAREKYKDRKCEYCGEGLPYEKRKNKFCNHSCAASYNNLGVSRNRKTLKIVKCCVNCNSVLPIKNNKFCSNECQSEYKYKIIKTYVAINGTFDGVIKDNKSIKRFLLKERGNKCEVCKKTKWMNKPMPLVLDHINGNSCDSRVDNLRLVCGNCDMQLPTYKSKNTGNGRYFRRKRYTEGKSY